MEKTFKYRRETYDQFLKTIYNFKTKRFFLLLLLFLLFFFFFFFFFSLCLLLCPQFCLNLSVHEIELHTYFFFSLYFSIPFNFLVVCGVGNKTKLLLLEGVNAFLVHTFLGHFYFGSYISILSLLVPKMKKCVPFWYLPLAH